MALHIIYSIRTAQRLLLCEARVRAGCGVMISLFLVHLKDREIIASRARLCRESLVVRGHHSITAVETNYFIPSAALSPGFYHMSLQHHLYHCSMSPCPVPSSLLITKLPPHVPTSHRYYCPLHTICSLHITKLLPHVPTTSPMPAQAHGFIWLRQHQFSASSYSIVYSYR
jgi:hypothetical protein